MFLFNGLMDYVVYRMSSSIRWFWSELIECYWRFVKCRGSCHQHEMEQEMLNTLDISCFSFSKSVLICVSVFVIVEGTSADIVL